MKTEHLRLSLLLENYPLERDWIGWENIYLHLHIEDPAHLIPQPFVFAIKPSILLQMVTVQVYSQLSNSVISFMSFNSVVWLVQGLPNSREAFPTQIQIQCNAIQ